MLRWSPSDNRNVGAHDRVYGSPLVVIVTTPGAHTARMRISPARVAGPVTGVAGSASKPRAPVVRGEDAGAQGWDGLKLAHDFDLSTPCPRASAFSTRQPVCSRAYALGTNRTEGPVRGHFFGLTESQGGSLLTRTQSCERIQELRAVYLGQLPIMRFSGLKRSVMTGVPSIADLRQLMIVQPRYENIVPP